MLKWIYYYNLVESVHRGYIANFTFIGLGISEVYEVTTYTFFFNINFEKSVRRYRAFLPKHLWTLVGAPYRNR